MGEESKYCPNCKKSIPGRNLMVHSVHCHEPRSPESMIKIQHSKTRHAPTPCPKCPGCGTPVEHSILTHHQREVCGKRSVSCKFCERDVPCDEMGKHLEGCGATKERCKGCSKFVPLGHLQFHYNNDHKFLSPEEKEKAESKEGEETEECPVCLGPITLPLALQCGHVFCMVCVKGIAQTTKNCAICRRDIQRDMLMDIRFCREEDIIKNYVNNPKYQKSSRSKNVPSGKVGATTRDYDDMVSALLSSRTSVSNYRYQRPNNSHTPPSYTPYRYIPDYSINQSSYLPTHSNGNKTSSLEVDHTSSTARSKSAPSTPHFKPSEPCAASTIPTKIRPMSHLPATRSPSTAATFPKEKRAEDAMDRQSVGATRPKRPTSLALNNSMNTTSVEVTEEPIGTKHLSQEEYDRWLAFQLAQGEDQIIQRSPFRRSRSMPEREEQSDYDDSEANRATGTNAESEQKRRNLSKSSSDSTPIVTTTGARPKSSTSLKKRVSFKEDRSAPMREAPVLLPCEFCDEAFPERDLMRHQTSCDRNETKNPREYLLSRRNSTTSQLTSPPSPLSPASPSSPISPTTTSFKRPPRCSATSNKSSNSRGNNSTLHSPGSPKSPSNDENSDTSASFSPCPASPNGCTGCTSSGISSISSSSVSTTPSTSNSTSPIPSTVQADIPTDIEADFEEESFPTPRKGRLLSSAIASWRTISASSSCHSRRPKYARSNTAPLEATENEDVAATVKSSSATPRHSIQQSPEDSDETSNQIQKIRFIRTKSKYQAPMPPKDSAPQSSKLNEIRVQEGSALNLDSPTVTNGVQESDGMDMIPCEFCKQVFSPRKFRNHQAVCEKESQNCPSRINHSRPQKGDGRKVQPKRTTKGPAPAPPTQTENIKRKSIERSHSAQCDFEPNSRTLERTESTRESGRSRATGGGRTRPWETREGLYSSCLDCSATYSGRGSLVSSTSSLNHSSGSGWSSHVNMIMDDVRIRRPNASFLRGLSSYFGNTRFQDRINISRHRSSSLYNTRTSFKIMADGFQGFEKGRFFR